MATFSLVDRDNDYQGFFITQQSKDNIVSLGDNEEFMMVHEANYSAISDGDEDFVKPLRFVLFVIASQLVLFYIEFSYIFPNGNLLFCSQLHLNVKGKAEKKRIFRN